jgi:hypothetical protein
VKRGLWQYEKKPRIPHAANRLKKPLLMFFFTKHNIGMHTNSFERLPEVNHFLFSEHPFRT